MEHYLRISQSDAERQGRVNAHSSQQNCSVRITAVLAQNAADDDRTHGVTEEIVRYIAEYRLSDKLYLSYVL